MERTIDTIDEAQLRQDVQFLAGRLPHRGSNTTYERESAEYIGARLREYTPETEMHDFYSIETCSYLFASYYLEFLIVGVVAVVWPWVGLVYGFGVFALYIAEFTGYSVMRRLLPHYETQNVMARFACTDPKRLLIVTANYDSAKGTILGDPRWVHRIRPIQVFIVFCMLAVLVSCAAQGMNVGGPDLLYVVLWIRWSALAVLIVAAVSIYTSDLRGEYVRGANMNASGVACLLNLARRLHHEPLESTEVWLVATGSKETWLSGMRELMRGLDEPKKSTYFLNITSVGVGKLRYATGEGMMHLFGSSREMLRLARASAGDYGAVPLKYRGLPTDALIPLSRGYKTMTIMATDSDDLPLHMNWHTDNTNNLEYGVLARAANFADRIVRDLDATEDPLAKRKR